MSYCIQYDSKKHPWEKRISHRKTVLIAIFICVAILLIGYLGFDKLPYVLPGESDVTALALETMVDSLQDGARLKDAIVAFCQEILDHAGVMQ